MQQALLEETIANIIKVEITREPGADTAQLVIKNDVTISTELRNRGKRLHVGTANVADSARAIFKLMKEVLEAKGYRFSDTQRENMPQMARGATGFSATASIDVGDKSDDELRGVFQSALETTKSRMGAARFRRIVGDWTDRKGGAAAELGGL